MKTPAGDFDGIENIIVDILANEVGIYNASTKAFDAINPARLFIDSQDAELPKDEGLFITVGVVDGNVISNTNDILTTDTTITEIQETVMMQNVQIDLISKNKEAREAKGFISMALHSIFAQQKQEVYNFKIFRIPTSFLNNSDAEGSSAVNRFTIVIPCHVWYRKEKVVSETGYYDKFKTRVDDETTISETDGLIEFEINEI
tara:strand:- start:704 stop:1312 length:609 start_codon:yes stop_codon:yes gene_type:complete